MSDEQPSGVVSEFIWMSAADQKQTPRKSDLPRRLPRLPLLLTFASLFLMLTVTTMQQAAGASRHPRSLFPKRLDSLARGWRDAPAACCAWRKGRRDRCLVVRY